MSRVLITGVAGFIGAHTLEHILSETNWEIVGLDSLKHRGNYRRIEQVIMKNPELWAQRFTFIKKDLNYKFTPQQIDRIGKIDYIINLAAESHVDRSIEAPEPFIKNNVNLVINMLEFARWATYKPKMFLQVSTDEVYGPMLDETPYVEWSSIVPSNPYSASKAAQEAIAISYWRTYGVPVVITNTMNNIGEMQDVEKFVPMLIRDILKGRKAKIHGTPNEIGSRYYLHARNHADALLYIMQELGVSKFNPDKSIHKPDRWNIVGDTRLDNLEMARKVAELLNKDLDYELVDFHATRPGHDMHYGLNGHALETLGWKAPLSFEESLARTVDNYKTHKEWLI